MARPRYIICCETRLVDNHTGLASHINVVDTLSVHLGRSAGEPIRKGFATPYLRWMLTSVWMRENGDEGIKFESEVYVLSPSGHSFLMAQQPFHFESDFFRIDTPIVSYLPKTAGIMRFVSQIRAAGSNNWISQDYPIVVSVTKDANVSDDGESIKDDCSSK